MVCAVLAAFLRPPCGSIGCPEPPGSGGFPGPEGLMFENLSHASQGGADGPGQIQTLQGFSQGPVRRPAIVCGLSQSRMAPCHH
eukprot:5601482-Pyramimonas_sp.AAC.1